MQMDVWDLLSGDLSAVATHVAPVERGGHVLGDAEHGCTVFFRNVFEECGVGVRYYEDVAGVYGLDVEESRAVVVAEDAARRQLACQYSAENAAFHVGIIADEKTENI